MKYKRISRARKRDLQQPDEFLTFSSRLIEAAHRYRKQLTWALIGILVIGVGIAGYGVYSNRAETEASALLSQFMEAYQVERTTGSASQALERVRPEMETLIQDYGSTTAGTVAKVFFARFYYDAEQPQDAIAFYKDALKDFRADTFYYASSLNGLGYAYEKAGDYASALDCFTQLSEGAKGFFQADGLYNAARMHARMEDTEKSQSALKELIAENPDYVYADLIASKIE